MMSLGIIRIKDRLYGYDANFDETTQRQYGEVCNREGETIHTTEVIYTSFQEAILAAQEWIREDAKNVAV